MAEIFTLKPSDGNRQEFPWTQIWDSIPLTFSLLFFSLRSSIIFIFSKNWMEPEKKKSDKLKLKVNLPFFSYVQNLVKANELFWKE